MNCKKLILITFVFVLSFAGVGYSSWIEGLNIESLFHTGNIHIIFQNPVIVNDELNEINASPDEGVLDITGTVASGSMVIVKFDIYNDSSIPVKYFPDDEAFPEGIILDLMDTVIKPGEYLQGQLTIEAGENEIILPFAQYNSSVKGGWKEELKISWNIAVLEEIVVPELEMLNENLITDVAPIEDVTQGVEQTETNPKSDTPDEDIPVSEPTVTEAAPEANPNPNPDTDSAASNPANNPAAENPTIEAPAENPAVEATSANPASNEKAVEDNKGSNEGTEKNVTDGEK